jgi:endoglucanase
MKLALFLILLLILTVTACGPQPTADIQPTAGPQIPSATAPAEQAVTDAPQAVEEPTAPAQEAEPMQPTPARHTDPAFAMNARLGRGVNLGNALEAPREGAWGVVIKEEFFPLIKEKGFNPFVYRSNGLPGQENPRRIPSIPSFSNASIGW